MEITNFAVGVLGVGSLVLAFAKYALERRKVIDIESHMKNPGLTGTA